MSTILLSTSTVFAESSYTLNQKRIFGNDRYETSALISKEGWKISSNVIICNGENFPDALCAVPLAKKYDAPILLNNKDSLNQNIKQELKRLNPDSVTIIGGKGVINSKVEDEIKSSVPNLKKIDRLGGTDRYETSKIIAEKVGKSNNIVLVSGKVPSDALSISSIAANKNMPILLADQNNNGIQNYVKSNSVTKTYIIGGEACVSKDIEKIVSNPERIYGKDRYESNEKILNRFQDSINFNNIYLTAAQHNGIDQFADALSSSALAAKNCNPVVLVNTDINKDTLNLIKSKVTKESIIIALGGEKIVSANLVDTLVNINSSPSKENNTSESSGGSSSSSNSNESSYTVSMKQSFPGAFTYDLEVTSNNGSEMLKGYKLLYDGTVIASDEDGDGITKPLSIFFGDDTDRSKFQISKDGKYINFSGIK
ncbi:hypothetical protein B5S50_10525 [Clostridium sp. 001]|nr:hypothetical protein B5S50_10525 [Clostridium sp. 001]